jgi:ATP synthase
MKLELVVVLSVLSAVQAFISVNYVSRTPVKSSTIVMDGKSRVLRDRIKSIKNTRRITEAMRLVAAARVRRAQDAVLRTRPLIGQLQQVIFKLLRRLHEIYFS